jgi:ubiquinone/menaquinone biosynthesis C-methylase UbiE
MPTLAPAPARSAISVRPIPPSVPFADPATGLALECQDNSLINPVTGVKLADVIDSIPRFVDRGGGYAATFGWQWKKWNDTLSDAANKDNHRRGLILERTHFNEYDLRGKTLLECGCGAGNDTEVLASLGFSEVHAFDLSAAVEEAAPLVKRAAADLSMARVVLSQADINRIPYHDRSFDVVYCHRVLQHTPDPTASIRSICKKVKPGGLLFAHCYHDSPLTRRAYRHKLRWLCKRLPPSVVVAVLNLTAPLLHRVNHRIRRRAAKGGRFGLFCQNFSHAWIPLAYSGNMWEHLGRENVIEIEKCITFDAITAWHEHMMTAEAFRAVIESEGFTMEHCEDTICTARLTRA